jgi:hypothetical protein
MSVPRFLSSLVVSVLVVLGASAVAHADPPAPVAPPPGSVAAAPAPMVTVHLSGRDDLALETALGDGSWGRVCTGACDTAVPLAGEYRVVGKGIRPSRGFNLRASPGERVVISLDGVSSKAGLTTGIVLAASSPGVFLAGFIVTIAGACAPPGGCDPGTPNRGVVDAGIGIMASSGAMLVSGIVLVALNAGHTGTTQTVGSLLSEPPARPETAWLRAPMWHDPVASIPTPSTVGVPLLTRTF